MITLSLVSTSELFRELEVAAIEHGSEDASKILINLKGVCISNYAELEALLNSGTISDIHTYNYLNKKLSSISTRLRKRNVQNRNFQIFTFSETLGDEVDAETLRITDEKNFGKVLLCPYGNQIASPEIAYGGTRWPYIKKRTVGDIKQLLGVLNEDTLKNEISSCKKMGPKGAQELVTAIGLYHEQILRQAQVTQERGIDLFSYQSAEKKQVIEEFFPIVAEQLIETTTATIWGPITQPQINNLRMASKSINAGRGPQLLREYLIEILANYSTLPEVSNFDNEAERAKVLKRIGPINNQVV